MTWFQQKELLSPPPVKPESGGEAERVLVVAIRRRACSERS